MDVTAELKVLVTQNSCNWSFGIDRDSGEARRVYP